jgi:hypothetical protein
MEEMMKIWTLQELMQLTRQELCELAGGIAASLPQLEAGTAERSCALTSLDNIRRTMLKRGYSP